MVVDESINHHRSRFRLIHGNHVASLMNLDEAHVNRRVGACNSTNPTDSLTVDGPFVEGSSVEIRLTRPGKIQCDSLIAHPVADEVVVTSVVEVTNTSFEERRNEQVEAVEPVASGLEHTVDGVVAGLPVDRGGNTQRVLDGSFVQEGSHLSESVAERRIFTLLSDVVGIEASVGVGGDLLVADFRAQSAGFIITFVTFSASLDARTDREVHEVGDKLGDARLVISASFFTASSSHRFVVRILNNGSNKTVTSGKSDKVDLDVVGTVVVGLVDGRGGGGSVVSTIGFTDNGQFVILHVRISSEEVLEESVVVMTNFFFVAVGATGAGIGVANTGRLIKQDDVSLVGPCIGVLVEFPGGFVDVTGSSFAKKRKHT